MIVLSRGGVRSQAAPLFFEVQQKKNLQLVQIDWLDAAGESQHIAPEEAAILQPLLRVNLGFVLDERDDAIVICAGLINDPDNQCIGCEGTTVIPRGMIAEVRELCICAPSV